MQRKFFIDFDSTFIKEESLSVMAEVSLSAAKDKEARLKDIDDITNESMAGNLDFGESLLARMHAVKFHKDMLEEVIARIKSSVSTSFLDNKDFLKRDNIYIISGGFKEIIVPIVSDFGICESRVFANTINFDKEGYAVGVDVNNPLSKHSGKVDVIRSLNISGESILLGDGHNDLVVKQEKLVDKFYAFTENVHRDNIVTSSDGEIKNLSELVNLYSSNQKKALLLENIHSKTVGLFTNNSFDVHYEHGSISEDELILSLDGVEVLGVRSKTKITRRVIENSPSLKVIGAFCIGVNQIDLDACRDKGIMVINAPYSNTRSVVELAMGEVVMLMRKIFSKSTNMHSGIWDKSSEGSFELRGKTLGLIGYGNIGSQLSVLAESFGMNVVYYDLKVCLPLGNARPAASLNELLSTADVVSLHVDGDPKNTNLIGEQEIKLMKDGVLLLNLSRGKVVDLNALKKALVSGKVGGASIDVFPSEPQKSKDNFECCLQGVENVILTPHIGGSTIEAQENIGMFVGEMIINYIKTGNTEMSLTLPNIRPDETGCGYRIAHLHRNTPGILSKINEVLSGIGINIEGQYLKTNNDLGYALIDVNESISEQVLKNLNDIKDTVSLRVINLSKGD